ncbi:DUF354 domain-containing protein [Halorubrum sp. GN11GM_10-3_MGM]|uniref:DUF354 domain-containing protein n=1 Tax=Halorubrum sp. GN11GM_10-3_MGM TaxID=2518111 RepID=UPI0010F502A9|nr:DUF354 domain-containing protein [Halorubrum sp. GN11GM_10-3_MGM]TKX69200.1 DUF354 domain-containing protein [Halorubrum sp. GN11GM_10-3_MGM]
MKIIFTIQHPAHVHLFRNSIRILEKKGHTTHVVARKKDITIDVLEQYNIHHEVLAEPVNCTPEYIIRQTQYEINVLKYAINVDPDLIVGMGEPSVAHVSSILRIPGIIFTDTENAILQNILSFPFADRVYTPTCYEGNTGKNQIRYSGYHELAYLHPNQFSPEPTILNQLGLDISDKFVIVRLNAWNSAHDLRDSGLDEIETAISKIAATGAKVLITSEPDIPDSLRKYHVDIPVDEIHNLMYYSNLLFGESATMAAESAVLGTPAIFVSTSRRGYTNELGDRYGLVYTFSGSDRQAAGVEKAVSILNKNDKKKWRSRRSQLLSDKIDTTEFIIDEIEGLI